MIIRAPWIVPVNRPPLKDHAMVVDKGRIEAMVPYNEASVGLHEIIELPETILLPGLINSHCHLELSALPHEISYPGTFVGWVAELTRLKMELTSQDYEKAFE